MRRQSFLASSCARLCVGIFVGAICTAADAPPDAWPTRPETSTLRVEGPTAPGDALALPPQTPAEMIAEPPPPTQAVPTGVRELLGPAVTLSPKESDFEVNAPDNASAIRVLEMCERMKTLSARFFTWPEQSLHIQVQLIPAARADFAGPYEIKPVVDGAPTVRVRYNSDTTLFDLCQAVSSVTLQNIVYAKDGAAPANLVPDWMKLGFAAWLEASIKPAMLDKLSDEARHLHMLTMSQIMSAHATTGPDVRLLAVNSFWLVMFLNDESGNSKVTHALFDSLAVGINPASLLGTAFGGKFEDPRDLELWWQVGLRDELAAHPPIFQTMAETRALLDGLERVALVRSNIPQRVRLDEAWDGRTDKSVRDSVEKTLLGVRELKSLDQANPVYKNALVSILIALEQYHGDDQKAFDFAWKQYLADRAAGEAIENTVNAALHP